MCTEHKHIGGQNTGANLAPASVGLNIGETVKLNGTVVGVVKGWFNTRAKRILQIEVPRN